MDRAILSVLQSNAGRTTTATARALGLSTKTYTCRLERLKALGFFRGTVTLLDASQLNLGFIERCAGSLAAFPEVPQFHRMCGGDDFVLQLVVPGIVEYKKFVRELTPTADVVSIPPRLALDTVMTSTCLSLDVLEKSRFVVCDDGCEHALVAMLPRASLSGCRRRKRTRYLPDHVSSTISVPLARETHGMKNSSL